jgi:ferredoxin--NADP+ reductase
MADHALEQLAASEVREVSLIGRRGPLQAAFTAPEVRELGELSGVTVRVRPEEAALDAASQTLLAASTDAAEVRKVETVLAFANTGASDAPRRLDLRFLLSPTEILGDAQGRVRALRLAKNRLVAGEGGDLRAEPTGEVEELPVELVFRSVGYRGLPIPGLPFDSRKGIVPNAAGRVVDGDAPVTGVYVSGWIKRGPSGVIGTNKPDAAETATAMLEDAESGNTIKAAGTGNRDVEAILAARGVHVVSWEGWKRIASREEADGKASQRPRVKRCRREEMLSLALDIG